MKHPLVLITLVVFSINNLLSQNTSIGGWSSHVPNNKGLSLCEAEDKIYCLTENGLFYYHTKDNSVQKVGKIEGLSDINTTAIYYHKATKTIYIGYADGNIDIIDANNKIKKINDITLKSFPTKTINRIQSFNNFLYISTDFGIVVFDPFQLEFVETYIIGSNGYELKVYNISINNNYIYAATENGVKKADLTNNQLANYANWSTITNYPNYTRAVNAVSNFANKLIVSQKNTWNYTYKTYVIDESLNTYFQLNPDSENFTQNLKIVDDYLMVIHKNHIGLYDSNFGDPVHFLNKTSFSWGSFDINTYDAIISQDGALWYADNSNGLVRNNYNDFSGMLKTPNAPSSNSSYQLFAGNLGLWMVYGAIYETGVNTYTKAEIALYKEGTWYNYNYNNFSVFANSRDLLSIEESPINNNKVMCTSGSNGVFEMDFTDFKHPTIVHHNDTSGSTLLPQYGHRTQVVDGHFDSYGNYYVTNPITTSPFQVYKNNSEWVDLEIGNSSTNYGKFIIANDGAKWVISKQGHGLYIYKEDETDDDFAEAFDVTNEYGEILNNNIYAITEDKDNQIWLGTLNGIVVYYNPEKVYDKVYTEFYGSKVKIDINGKIEYLMEGKKVNTIAVDGANRKWIGTDQSGVFLVSPDGTEQILTFNKDNSPLPSDKINSIAIDKTTGEVFIATGNGLMSYRGDATEGSEFFQDVYTFPNPVKPDYNGPITITGLMNNTTVKITDISGNLVTELKSNGGQAIWDGNTLNGQRVKTGVYLVFLSAEFGEYSAITKILFIN
jgi:ligand-binding sensor domain-containing protein